MTSHRVLIFIMTIASVWATYSVTVQQLELPLFTIFARMAPSQVSDAKVALVAIDEKTIKSMGSWPWGYRQMSRLVQPFRSYKGKSVVWLPELTDSKTLDQKHIESLVKSLNRKDKNKFLNLLSQLDYDKTLSREITKSRAMHLTIPYFTTAEGATSGSNLIPALDVTQTLGNSNFGAVLDYMRRTPQSAFFPGKINTDIAKSAKVLGYYPQLYPGELIVQEPLFVKIQQQYYPSSILRTLAAINAVPLKKIEYIADEGIQIGGHVYQTDSAFNIVPRIGEAKYSNSIVPVYSAIDVINRKVKISELNEFDSLVVGVTAGGSSLVTVYTGEEISYPVWFANAVNMIIQDHVIKLPYWSQVVQRSVILVLALYFLLLPLRLRGYIGLAFSLFLAVLAVNAIFFAVFLYSTWLKLTIPIIFLMLGHILIAFHFKVTMAFKSLQLEAANAYRELALNEQTQGNLDKAFAYMRKCPMDKKLLECLYNLGIEFESRRQFRQAVAVYEYISRKDASYRDIQERRARHQTVSNPSVLTRSATPNTAATLVVDHPNVARPVLGRYQIEKIVGQGAMGTVYMGIDPKIGRTVAIKTLALSEEFEPKQLEDVRRRFFREAETAGRLNHPNIVTIYDVGEEHDLAYIAMDFITGQGLDNFVQGETLLSIEEVFQIGVDVAEALDYAHCQNVVHRDVKPANIIYDPNTQAVKVTDYGIACLTDTSKTRTGTIMGSPSYMSPEQLEGSKVDGRSDLYSLGVTLYQLFTAALPFTAESMTSLAYKIVKDKPKGVRQLRSELPVCLSRIINKALEKDPNNRYQRGEDFANALKRCGGL